MKCSSASLNIKFIHFGPISIIRLFQQEDASQEDASMILLFEDVNYKVKSTQNACESRETYSTFFSETDNLKSILLKAALQKIGRREEKQNAM